MCTYLVSHRALKRKRGHRNSSLPLSPHFPAPLLTKGERKGNCRRRDPYVREAPSLPPGRKGPSSTGESGTLLEPTLCLLPPWSPDPPPPFSQALCLRRPRPPPSGLAFWPAAEGALCSRLASLLPSSPHSRSDHCHPLTSNPLGSPQPSGVRGPRPLADGSRLTGSGARSKDGPESLLWVRLCPRHWGPSGEKYGHGRLGRKAAMPPKQRLKPLPSVCHRMTHPSLLLM